jgi:signal transduction histidine kinase
MSKFSLSSLRSRAIILVLLAILPVMALTLYSYFDHRQIAIREMQRDELSAVRILASLQETLIGTTRQLLMTLARLPQVQRRDPVGCNALLAEVAAQCPYYGVLAAVDSQGQMFAIAPGAPGPINYADRLWFQKTVRTLAFVIGEPIRGRTTNKYLINLAYPILDDAGRLQGVLTAGLDLTWLGSQFAKSDSPPGTAIGLTDSTGKVLYRYPEPLKYIGRMLPYPLIQAMAAGNAGVAAGVGVLGEERLFAFARLSPPWQDLRVAIGLPRKWAVDKVNRDLRRNLIWLGLVAILALAAAWFGSGLVIVQPLRNLRRLTGRLAAGNLEVRAGPAYPVGELGFLAQDFDHMAAALQERDADLLKIATELRQRAQELTAANQELENFTYSVAHDLRAPLRSMGSFARILLEDYPDQLDADGQRYLNIIQQEARRMGQLIDDLLALARLGRKKLVLTRLDMAELAQQVFNELKAAYPQRNLQIEVQPLPAVLGDPVMFRQLLANLLDNAIKFTQARESALIQVSGWKEGEENVYCIKDNGVGFDMRFVNKLFEVFQRLHPEDEFGGTGVGLAIVKRVIDRHGGRVWAESKLGEGTTICFALPTREEA